MYGFMKNIILIILAVTYVFWVNIHTNALSPWHCQDIHWKWAIEIWNTCWCKVWYIKWIVWVDSPLCKLDHKKCTNMYWNNAEMTSMWTCWCKGSNMLIEAYWVVQCRNPDSLCKNRYWQQVYFNKTFWDCRCNSWYSFSKTPLKQWIKFNEVVIIWNECIRNNSNTNTSSSTSTNTNTSSSTNIEINNNHLEWAKILANKWIINYQENAINYNLNKTISRKEMLKVMMNLSWKNVWEDCEWKFKDLPKNDWGCKYAESALIFWFISGNQFFKPNNDISKIEAVKMILQSKNIEIYKTEDWRVWYINKWVELWLFNNFTDYDSKAIRWWIFEISNNLINYTEQEEVSLDSIFADDYDNTNMSCWNNSIINNDWNCICIQGYSWEDENDKNNLNCLEEIDIQDLFKDL